MIVKYCRDCGKEFETNNRNKEYCNGKCRQRYYERTNRKIKTSACEVCGKKLIYGDHRQKYCSNECHKHYRKLYRRIWRIKRQSTIDRYKQKKGCKICGYNKCPNSLDHHHIYGKDFRIRTQDLYSYITTGNEKIKRELDKCILICKNCHYNIHYKEMQKKRRKILLNVDIIDSQIIPSVRGINLKKTMESYY